MLSYIIIYNTIVRFSLIITQIILSLFKINQHRTIDIDEYLRLYSEKYLTGRIHAFSSDRTIKIECKLGKIDDMYKPEILSEIYQQFKTSKFNYDEYRCDIAEVVTKMIEIILQNYVYSDTDFLEIIDNDLEILLHLGDMSSVR